MNSSPLKLFPLLFEVANPKTLPLHFQGLYAFTTAMERVLNIQMEWIEDLNNKNGIKVVKSRSGWVLYYNPRVDAVDMDFFGSGHDLFHLLTLNMAQHFGKVDKETQMQNRNNVSLPSKKKLFTLVSDMETLGKEYSLGTDWVQNFKTASLELFNKYDLNSLKLKNLNSQSTMMQREMAKLFVSSVDSIKLKVPRELNDKFFNSLLLHKYIQGGVSLGRMMQVARNNSYFPYVFDNHFNSETNNKAPQHEVEETIGNYVVDVLKIQDYFLDAQPVLSPEAVARNLIMTYKSEREGIRLTTFKKTGDVSPEDIRKGVDDRGLKIAKELAKTLVVVLRQYNENLKRMGLGQ